MPDLQIQVQEHGLVFSAFGTARPAVEAPTDVPAEVLGALRSALAQVPHR